MNLRRMLGIREKVDQSSHQVTETLKYAKEISEATLATAETLKGVVDSLVSQQERWHKAQERLDRMRQSHEDKT